MTKVVPGFAFSLACDLGFAVGLVTHQVPGIGDLVWLAEPTFDEEPDAKAVQGIVAWRWPVLIPVGPMVRRRLVTPIGAVAIPGRLQELPLMRSGNRKMGWREVRVATDGSSSQPSRATTDATLPIYRVVNDTRLKEMLVSAWRPEDDW